MASLIAQAGWQTAPAALLEQLKLIQPRTTTDLAAATRTAFDLLNQYRLSSGIDNFGNVYAFASVKTTAKI